MKRRQFLMASAWSLIGGLLYSRFSFAGTPKAPANYLIGPCIPRNDGDFGVAVLDLSERRTRFIHTGFEGHSIVAKPGQPGRAVMFAQRPGTRCCEVDYIAGEVVRVFDSAEGRHFYGHGAFSNQADHLFTTENNFEDEHGLVTIRDTGDMEIVGEFDSHGLGPHEMFFIDGGNIAVIANGGLKTSPKYKDGYKDYDRESLNSSLVLIETASGTMLDRFNLENRFLSIRHLSISPNQTIAMAIQDKENGESYSGGPLICVRFPDGKIVEMQDEGGVYKRMGHHTLSISLFEERSIVGVTSPFSDLVTFWDIQSGKLIKKVTLDSPSGLALTGDKKWFVATANNGSVYFLDSETLEKETISIETPDTVGWGSHLASVMA